MFSEAASNISVGTATGDNDEVKIQLLDSENEVELTNKSYSMKKLKKQNATLTYGSFLKSSTLQGSGEQKNMGSISNLDIEIKPVTVISDEELFRVCGGRTAHKSARHGLKLEGKLRRVEEQEKEFLEKIKKAKEAAKPADIATSSKSGKRAQILLNSSTESNQEENSLPLEDDSKDYSIEFDTKRKRKRDKLKTSELASKILVMDLDGAPAPKKTKSLELIPEVDEKVNQKKKKKSKKQKNKDKQIDEFNDDDDEGSNNKSRKSKKKRSEQAEEMSFVKNSAKLLSTDENSSLDNATHDQDPISDDIEMATNKKKRSKKSKRRKQKNETKKVLEIFEKQLNLSIS